MAPTTVLPSNKNSLTGSFSRISTPKSLAISPILCVIVPKPPFVWKTPCSYSRYARIVNRLGAWNGLIPKYLVWKDIASCILSSGNNLDRSEATLLHGLRTLATRKARLFNKSVGPLHGALRQFLDSLIFVRLSSIYLLKPAAFFSPQRSLICSVISSKSVLAFRLPPDPNTSL